MQYKINGYEPEKLFRFFEEISAIPRGSYHEQAISDFLVAFAKERGLWCDQDAMYNVIIKKPASAGAENAPAVMMQGHLDMVCEKRAGVAHDFETEGLELVLKDGVLRANGTTLGGDNGVAVALMMTVLDDDTLVHPALECVFTTQEEVGLGGASALDFSKLQARTMINLDSEDEGVATVSCAGGMRYTLARAASRTAAQGVLVHLNMTGLLGGHSGIDIDQERINANQLMGRMVRAVMQAAGGQLVSFAGGTKDNAIPRECAATLLYTDEAAAHQAMAVAQQMQRTLSAEITPFEPDFVCTVEAQPGAAEVLSDADARAFLGALALAPNGVRRRNLKQDAFVVTSLNLGVARADGDTMQLIFAPRSSVDSLQEDTKQLLALLADTFGFTTEIAGAYPGWAFAETSPVRDCFCESYRTLFGEELRIEAIHAGLECGLFSHALEGLDAIAVGPTIKGCHTPDEYLPLDSTQRFYTLLRDVLERLAHR